MTFNFNQGLTIAQIITFTVTAITSVPLFSSYLRGVDTINPIFTHHLPVWFGFAFILIAIIKISIRKKLILNQLGLKDAWGNLNGKNEPAIEVSNLTKSFGRIIAVNGMSFTVSKGEIFGFLGPNGAGKTTTIRMLTGILAPDKGSIKIDGINLAKDPIRAKMVIGVIPEAGNVYGDLTAKQNLALTGRYYGLSKGHIAKRTEEILTALGLYERGDDFVRTFSKGMKQRVSIACAIIHEPKILFLDEPTEGLDVQSRRLIVDTIQRMNKLGCTVFLTTHNIEEANRLCEKVCIINKGKIAAIDSPEKLKSTFEKTQTIEISFNQRIDKEALSNEVIFGVESMGDKLRLHTDNPDKAVKYLVALAQEHGVEIVSLVTCGPSLEEAFLRLTGGGE